MNKVVRKGWVIIKPNGDAYSEQGGFPFLYHTLSGARSATKTNWDICRCNKEEAARCNIVEMTLTYEWEFSSEDKQDKTGPRKFAAHVESSVSGDDYYFQFEAKSMPQTDIEWLGVFQNEPSLSGEMNNRDFQMINGPGIAGTYLWVKSCVEVL